MMLSKVVGAVLAALSVAVADPQPQSLPVLFVPNHRPASRDVAFVAHGSGLRAFFTRDEASFNVNGQSVRMQFMHTTGEQHIEPLRALSGKANFLIGSEDEWEVGIPIYDGIAYRNLYRGIDMVYRGQGRNLKSEFRVRPG